MFDPMYSLVWESEVSFSVLGRANGFLLIDNSADLDRGDETMARVRGYEFCGVVALTKGVPTLYCEPYPEAAFTMAHAVAGFCHLMADRIEPPHPYGGDSVSWLSALHNLPDPR